MQQRKEGGRLDEALEVGLETEVQKNTLLQHEVEHGVRSGAPGTHVLEGSPPLKYSGRVDGCGGTRS